MKYLRLSAVVCGCLCFSALAQTVPAAQSPDAPEPASRTVEKKAAFSTRDMVATANPLATEAALDMLRRGGSAIDAAIAAQLVLGLVEAQSSGIGGGGFLLYHDTRRRQTVAYDGRETAPADASPDLFLDAGGKPLSRQDAVWSGKSVGVPGVLRMLEAAHAAHGRLPWTILFAPAIALAENGYPMTERTRGQLLNAAYAKAQPAARKLFFDAAGQPWPVGTLLKNPAYAAVVRRVAREGTDAFYRGALARDMAVAVQSQARPGTLSEADLAAYRVRIGAPVCGPYRRYVVCGMPPPSSGGVGMAQMLGMLERFNLGALQPMSAEAIHLVSEAGRLAFADRDRYLADDRFADVPVAALIDPGYLKRRSALIRPDRSMGRAEAGMLQEVRLAAAADGSRDETGTSHIAVVDRDGNATSFTTSVDASFGSQIFVNGYFLNNQLTDFAFAPFDAAGMPVANAVYPGKRPRSTMSPTIVFDRDGRVFMLTGSALGSFILNAAVKTVIGVVDWRLGIQSAIALPNVGSRNGPTEVERRTTAEAAIPALKAIGHEVRSFDIPTGIQGIARVQDGWEGGADPRREGLAKGR